MNRAVVSGASSVNSVTSIVRPIASVSLARDAGGRAATPRAGTASAGGGATPVHAFNVAAHSDATMRSWSARQLRSAGASAGEPSSRRRTSSATRGSRDVSRFAVVKRAKAARSAGTAFASRDPSSACAAAMTSW
jgi:hypothetical protein